MPRKEAKEVLTKGFEKIGLSYDDQALDCNIDVAGGYPHSIQIIGHHLVEVDRDGKNIYTATCLGELKKSGAVKELLDGAISLHSMLFRAAILIHLYTHMKTNASYRELIERHAPSENPATLPTSRG